ncbi:hypothetical protein EJB05_23570 [Eragrostis curvula]|uniref:Uncharacterized protein n=1 Tax=Eragrostis curvula TaxID=38414 RepID=A0A5J9V8V4_9POAL|nr:hypothetical protein EJB05_23570 [Eragrostis curvula]
MEGERGSNPAFVLGGPAAEQGDSDGFKGFQEKAKRAVISLIPTLKNVLKKLDGPNPTVETKKSIYGLSKVVVSFDTDQLKHKDGFQVGNQQFSSKWVVQYDEGEREACIQALKFLMVNYNVIVQDFSYFQIQMINDEVVQLRAKSEKLQAGIDPALDDWQNSITWLKELAESYGEHSDWLSAEFKGRAIKLTEDTEYLFNRYSQKLSRLQADAKGMLMSELIGTERVAPQAHGNKDTIYVMQSQKDMLDNILEALKIQKAKYNNTPLATGLFTAYCMVELNNVPGFDGCGCTMVPGAASMEPFDAECSAAEEAIKFIVRKMNLRIVDMNYDDCMLAVEQLYARKEHLSRTLCLANSVVQAWETLLSDLKLLPTIKDGAYTDLEDEDVDVFKVNCQTDVDSLLNDIQKSFSKSIPELKSLISLIM